MIGNKAICKTKEEMEHSRRVEVGLLEERSWLKVAFIMPSCAKPHLNFDIFRIDIVRCSTPPQYYQIHKYSRFESSKMTTNALNAVYKWAIPVAIGGSFVQASMYDVKGGTRAVIFDRLSGVKENVVNEGTHFLIPWLQKSIIYDVRTKPRNISTTTGSKDLQMVSLTLRVLHRPEVPNLPKIYQV